MKRARHLAILLALLTVLAMACGGQSPAPTTAPTAAAAPTPVSPEESPSIAASSDPIIPSVPCLQVLEEWRELTQFIGRGGSIEEWRELTQTIDAVIAEDRVEECLGRPDPPLTEEEMNELAQIIDDVIASETLGGGSLAGSWRLPFQAGFDDGHVKVFRQEDAIWVGFIQELGSLLPRYGYVVGEQVFRRGIEISPGVYEGEGLSREGKEGGGILTTWEATEYVVLGGNIVQGELVYSRVR